MEYDRPFRASIFLLVLAGAVTLTLSEINLQQGSPVYLVIALVAIALSWVFLEGPRLRQEAARARGEHVEGGWSGLPRWLANGLAVLGLGYAYVDGAQVSGDKLLALAHLLLWIQVVKLFQVKRDRDWMQLALLSVMHVGAAAAMTIEVTFAIGLFIYMGIGVWAMLLYALRKETRECREHAGVVLAGGRRNNWALAFLVLVMLVFTVTATSVFFLVFPRTGQDFLNLQLPIRAGQMGFSDQMQLGQINELLDNPAVAMTVQVEGGVLPVDVLRMRGTVYDRYDGGQWKDSFTELGWRQYLWPADPGGAVATRDHTRRHDRPLRMQPLLDGTMSRGDVGARSTSKVVVLDVTLEPSSSRFLFTHVTSVYLLGGEGTFDVAKPYEHQMTGSVRLSRPTSGKLRYALECHLGSTNLDAYAPDPTLRPGARRGQLHGRERFLHVPEELVASGRIRELAETVTADAETPVQKAQALVRYLREEYEYSTDDLAVPAGRDPVEYFLFERQSGHCEFFASALALLLRSIDIPSRVVNGFVGGEYNEIAEVYTLRQNNAHAWVEAHFEDVAAVVHQGGKRYSTGWLTFDASPVDIGSTSASVTDFWRQLLEFFRVKWDSHVLGFERRHQQTLLRGVTGGTEGLYRNLTGWLQVNLRAPGGGGSSGNLLGPLLVFAGLLFAAFSLLAPTLFRRRGHRASRRRASLAFYDRTLRLLARNGYRRAPGETPLELARRVVAEHPDADALTRLTDAYNERRFGDGEGSIDPDRELDRLREQLRSKR